MTTNSPSDPEQDSILKDALFKAAIRYGVVLKVLGPWASGTREEFEAIYSETGPFQSGPEYTAAIKALESHPLTSTHANRLIGTGGSLLRLEPRTFLFGFVRSAAEEKDPTASLETLFSDFLEFFKLESVVVRYTSFLFNFDSDVDRVDIADGFRIKRLSESEKAKALEEAQKSFLRKPIFVPPEFVLEYSQVQKKYVVSNDEFSADPGVGGTSPYEHVPRQFDRAVSLLRLLKSSGVYRDGVIASRPDGFFARVAGLQFGSTTVLETYGDKLHATASDVNELLQYWATYDDKNPKHQLVLDRLGFSMERRHNPDCLLDLFIALEALYLPDTTQEVSFRLALRTAKVLSISASEAKELFRFLKQMYTIRSRIAHGRHANPEQEKINRLREITRKSIKSFFRNPKLFTLHNLDEAMIDDISERESRPDSPG